MDEIETPLDVLRRNWPDVVARVAAYYDSPEISAMPLSSPDWMRPGAWAEVIEREHPECIVCTEVFKGQNRLHLEWAICELFMPADRRRIQGIVNPHRRNERLIPAGAVVSGVINSKDSSWF